MISSSKRADCRLSSPNTTRFANAPVNAQGGKVFNDATSSDHAQARSGDLPPDPFSHPSDVAAGAPQYESAEQEKARLQQQYASASAAGAGADNAATARAVSSLPTRVKALSSFEGQEADDLHFKVGDIIEVTGKEDDMWWRGVLAGRSGIFPMNYVEAL